MVMVEEWCWWLVEVHMEMFQLGRMIWDADLEMKEVKRVNLKKEEAWVSGSASIYVSDAV